MKGFPWIPLPVITEYLRALSISGRLGFHHILPALRRHAARSEREKKQAANLSLRCRASRRAGAGAVARRRLLRWLRERGQVTAQLSGLSFLLQTRSEQEQAEEDAELFLLGPVSSPTPTSLKAQHFEQVIPGE